MRQSLRCLPITVSLLLLCACLPPTASPTCSPLPISPPSGCLRPQFAADVHALPEAPRYDVQLVVKPAVPQVTGHLEVRYTNAERVPQGELYLRLFPNTPGYGGGMTVTNLSVESRAVAPFFELDGSALRLPLEPPLQPGQGLTVGMDFAVTVPTTDTIGYAQLSHVRGVMALPNIYPLIPVHDDEGWNLEIAPDYGDAVYSDVAFYRVRVTAPPTLTLIASGCCAGLGAGSWTCEARPVRDFVLILGEEYRQASQVVDGVTINSYFYPGHEEGGTAALQVAADALVTFTDLFGSYPYVELDVVETPTRAGGIEYPGLVVISERLYEGRPRLEWVVAHEVGHQWWYGLVGNDQVDEPWLDEALTQYSTLLYHERLYGVETAADILHRHFAEVHRNLVAAGADRPVGLPVAAYERDLYGPVVYQKGALYFHALRERVGDERFFAILRAYYARHRYGIATPGSFLEVVNIVSGDPHLDLFEEWIQGVAGE